jgi:hypothetical protein
MIPRDHMSTFGPYSLRVTNSGAIQYGVPTIVVRFACAGSVICAQKPKSAKVGTQRESVIISGEGLVIRTEFNVTGETQ